MHLRHSSKHLRVMKAATLLRRGTCGQRPPFFSYSSSSSSSAETGFEVSSWGESSISQTLSGHQYNSNCPFFITRSYQFWGRLESSFSAIPWHQWSNCLFTRLMSSNSKLERRKRDLARREFQLLRRRKKLLKATMSPEERLLWRLRKSNRKKAVLLQRLKKFELEEDPELVHDPELITQEQHQAFKKIGYKNRNYVPVGRRGVYGGVVQNMHMHWKFHETVQVDCHIFKQEDVRTVARQLAVLSGGIVIDIHQSTNIIMYRGRNYKQPKSEMTPPNTLTKRKALFKSKYRQALDGLETNIQIIESELQTLRQKQKNSLPEGAAVNTSKLPQITDGFARSSVDILDEMSSDDDDDEDAFKWDTDSLDNDELSDDEDDGDYDYKSEKIYLDMKAANKSLSLSLKDTAERLGKKTTVTTKELITAEQALFKNGPTKNLDGGLKKGLDHAEVEDELKTDDEDEEHICKHIGERNGVAYGAESNEPANILEAASSRGKGYEQIKNKKIAKFVEDFATDEDEDDKIDNWLDEEGSNADQNCTTKD